MFESNSMFQSPIFSIFLRKNTYTIFLLNSSIKCLRRHSVYVCYQNLLTYSPASKINAVPIVPTEHLSTSEKKKRANIGAIFRGRSSMTGLSLS